MRGSSIKVREEARLEGASRNVSVGRSTGAVFPRQGELTAIRILLLTLGCLAFVATAEAGRTWIGPQLHFPLPTRDVGDTQLGVDAGVTLTRMKSAHVGVGLDLIYHYWPASSPYQAAFDRHLRSTRFQTLESPTWAFSALQVTGHVKLVALVRKHYAPWAKVGVGGYRLNRNLEETRPEGTYAWVEGRDLGNISIVPGWCGGAGLDFSSSSRVALGLDATFHYVWSPDKAGPEKGDVPDFTAFTIGMHVLFGWE
jgi:hypothetical protein